MSAATPRSLPALLTGYANLAVMALVTAVLIPLYARLLDAQQWGIVATCMTIHGLLFAMDVALSPLVVRDVAQRVGGASAAALRHRFLRLYIGCALGAVAIAELVLAILGSGLAGAQPPELPSLLWPLQVALLSFALQFANSALIGYWSGRGRLALANVRSAGFVLLKHGLALASVVWIERSALGYLVPFAVGAAIELALNLRATVESERAVSPDDEAATVVDAARSLPADHFALYLASSTLAVAVAQADRVVLSMRLGTAEFGVYYLVSYVIAALLTLQMPIARTYLPQIAASAAPVPRMRAMYRSSFWLLLLPCLIGLAVAPWALSIWLPPGSDVAAAVLPLRCMLAGVMLLVLYAPVSNYLFSRRRYRGLLLANALALAVQVALLLALSGPLGGLLAGGLAWLACGIVFTFFSLFTIWRTPELWPLLGRQSA